MHLDPYISNGFEHSDIMFLNCVSKLFEKDYIKPSWYFVFSYGNCFVHICFDTLTYYLYTSCAMLFVGSTLGSITMIRTIHFFKNNSLRASFKKSAQSNIIKCFFKIRRANHLVVRIAQLYLGEATYIMESTYIEWIWASLVSRLLCGLRISIRKQL